MTDGNKKNIAVLFGGRSAEHEISIITALEIMDAMDTERYSPIPVYINSRGRWYTGEALRNKAFYPQLPESLSEVSEVALLPVPGTGGLTVISDKRGMLDLFSFSKQQVIPVDVFFPAFHGTFGEDGCIQGLFEMADVIYTGSGVIASAVAMNKYVCKSVLHAHKIPVLPATVVSKRTMQKDVAKVREQIYSTAGLEEFPLFVKPVNLGSSIGIGKAEDEQELDAALARVFEYDTEAIVEPCVTNLLELNVSVLEGPEGPEASVTEIPVSSSGVLTYEDKYLREGKGKKGVGRRVEGMAGLTRVIDPEDLSEDLKSAVTHYALEAYRVLGCSGVARFDFMIDTESDQPYFNELNPLPGSMAYYLWDKSTPPLLYTEMLTRIIEGAIERAESRTGVQRDLGFRALLG